MMKSIPLKNKFFHFVFFTAIILLSFSCSKDNDETTCADKTVGIYKGTVETFSLSVLSQTVDIEKSDQEDRINFSFLFGVTSEPMPLNFYGNLTEDCNTIEVPDQRTTVIAGYELSSFEGTLLIDNDRITGTIGFYDFDITKQ